MSQPDITHIYARMGECLWMLQHVEHALYSFIAAKVEIKTPGALSQEAAQRALDKHARNTLGTSVRIAREHGVLSSELLQQIEWFKQERDWLIHRLTHTDGRELDVPSREQNLLARLDHFASAAKALQTRVGKEMEHFVISMGISKQAIEAAAQKILTK